MDLSDWANGTVYALGEYTSLRQFFDGTDWQEWGMQFFTNPTLGQLNPPNPYAFSDWRPWAEQLQDGLLNATGSSNAVSGPGLLAGTSPTARFMVAQSGNNLVTQDGRFLVTH
jgi:hypothetical protein